MTIETDALGEGDVVNCVRNNMTHLKEIRKMI